MRTKLILIAAAMLTLVAGCHKKGGGYLAPIPVNNAAAR